MLVSWRLVAAVRSRQRRNGDECALYVVTGIEVTRAGQEVVASGGSIDVVLRPWRVDAVGELLPKTFEYRLAPR